MTNVVGTLLNPLGNPIANVALRFTALASEGDTLQGVSGIYSTDSEGKYNFTLVQGRYTFELLDSEEYHLAGEVLVDGDLPAQVTLQELVLFARPYEPTPAYLGETNWEELFQEVRDNNEWNRRGEDQVRDGNTLVNENKVLQKSGSQYLPEYMDTLATGSAEGSFQRLAYEDEFRRQAATQAFVLGTGSSEAKEVLLATRDRDGTTQAKHTRTLWGGGYHEETNTGAGSSTHIRNGSSEALSSLKVTEGYTDITGVNYGDIIAKEERFNVNAGWHEGEIHNTQEIKYVDAHAVVEAFLKQGIKLSYSRLGYPLEGFRALEATENGIVETIQLDRQIIQARDGHKVVTIDTEDRKITFDAEVVFTNTDDFIGEEGWSYDYEHEYSDDQIDWSPEYTFGDTWRRSRKFRFKDKDPVGTKEYISTWEIIQLNAQDGAAGDNFYMEYQYTTAELYPNGWHDTYTSADDWRRWRTVRITATGNEISAWQVEPIKGTDGPEGWIPEYQLYYGPDGTKPLYTDQDNDGSLDDINLAHWHPNLVNEDVYKYERRVWWKTQADFTASRNDHSMVPHVMEPWVGPVKIKPVAGEDYGNKNATLFLYQRSVNKPTTEPGNWRYTFSTDTLVPVGSANGWHTGMYAGLEPMWVATGRASSLGDVDSSVDNWDVDMLTSNGTKTATAFLYRVTDSTVNSVPLPTAILTYNFGTGLVEGSFTNNWVPTPPNNVNPKGKLWRTFAPVTAEAYTEKEPIAVDDWEDATVLAQNGSNGVDGGTGASGSNTAVVYLYKRAENAGSNPSATCTYNFAGKVLTGNNNGWQTLIPGGTGKIWVISATANSVGAFDDIAPNEWSGAALLTEGGLPGANGADGLNGINTATIMLYRRSNSPLDNSHRPSANVTYTFATGAVSGLNNGWNTIVSGGTEPIWVTTATALSRDATDTIAPSEWATPQILASSGAAGKHGAGTYVVVVSSESAADLDNKDVQIQNQTGRAALKGDILTYTNSLNGPPTATFSKSFLYNGSHWETFKHTFNGSVIVHGTLGAETLKADTALLDNLRISSASSDAEVVLSGSGKHSGASSSNYRLWAGNANAAAAPFSVDKFGNMVARNGTFMGNLQMIGSAFMKVENPSGWGSEGLWYWFGPKNLLGDGTPNYAYMTKANASEWKDVGGNAYFGGSLSAGTIKVGAKNTSTWHYPVGSSAVEVGPFGTSGKPKNVVVSYRCTAWYTRTDEPPAVFPEVIRWKLQREINGTWSDVPGISGTFTGTATKEWDYEMNHWFIYYNCSGSVSGVDSNTSTLNTSYRVYVLEHSRSFNALGNQTQEMSLLSVEQ